MSNTNPSVNNKSAGTEGGKIDLLLYWRRPCVVIGFWQISCQVVSKMALWHIPVELILVQWSVLGIMWWVWYSLILCRWNWDYFFLSSDHPCSIPHIIFAWRLQVSVPLDSSSQTLRLLYGKLFRRLVKDWD